MKLTTKLPIDQFSVDQLVLQVSESVDPQQLDLSDYEDFLISATQGRAYQRAAIEATVRFLCGGCYVNTEQLARENYASSADLRRRYSTADALVQRLPFPDKIACSLDLATGTGKSFIYHAIARIALNEGIVDRVLLLCPSLTIEEGLKDKFNALIADSDLVDLLPERAGGIRIPDIVDAGSTVKTGQICVENIHATYERTGSSIRDSFAGQGEHTLVISDEAHHIYSPSEATLKRWKEFLDSPAYSFHYHVGGSGTCYIKNDYFADVICRYPIRQAIEDRWVKEVFYLDKDNSATDYERFQKLLARHEKNRKIYAPLKPLTIAVTANIKAAEELAGQLVTFLAGELKITSEEAESRVLIVTSSAKHKANVVQLKNVDAASSPTEWIVSVSMLSEGWDVQNVFQIYPHEKRAFNSKLLVSQVLGRGLRLPVGLPNQSIVYVFNHQRWGPEIEEIVAEVLDVETTIAQRPTQERPVPHIQLHNVVYDPVPTGVKAKKLEKPAEIEVIALRPQRAHDEQTTFVSATDVSRIDVLTTRVVHRLYPVEHVVADVRQRMLEHDKAVDGNLAKLYPRERIAAIISASFEKLHLDGKQVSQENRQLILSAFGSLRQRMQRPGAELRREPTGLNVVDTNDMRPVTARISGLTSHLGLFYDVESHKLGTADDAAALKKASAISIPTWLTRVSNSFLFKSPVNLVLTSHRPEYLFVERLMEQNTAQAVRSWVKAPDSGFYSIEFSFKVTPLSRRRVAEFNPDFFLRLSNQDMIVAVETKADGDVSPLNVGKLAAATEHFATVNRLLEEARQERRYSFHILGPDDYDDFFDALHVGDLDQYVSSLQAALT